VDRRSLDWRRKRSGTRKESPHHDMIDEPLERFDGGIRIWRATPTPRTSNKPRRKSRWASARCTWLPAAERSRRSSGSRRCSIRRSSCRILPSATSRLSVKCTIRAASKSTRCRLSRGSRRSEPGLLITDWLELADSITLARSVQCHRNTGRAGVTVFLHDGVTFFEWHAAPLGCHRHMRSISPLRRRATTSLLRCVSWIETLQICSRSEKRSPVLLRTLTESVRTLRRSSPCGRRCCRLSC
jgi:hypothetical protein